MEAQAHTGGSGLSKPSWNNTLSATGMLRIHGSESSYFYSATLSTMSAGYKPSLGSFNMAKSHLSAIMKFPQLETIPDDIMRIKNKNKKEEGNLLQKNQNKVDFYDYTYI